MDRPSNALVLVPLHADHRPWAPPLLERLVERLSLAFHREVRVQRHEIDLVASYDHSRGQHNAPVLVEQLAAIAPDGGAQHLGLIGRDLFIPLLTHVFGLAQLGGRAAATSTHRLNNEFYGLPADPERLARRLEKESIHELGHTFGLIHCASPDCVMHSSTDVREIDLKPPHFCRNCHRRITAAEP